MNTDSQENLIYLKVDDCYLEGISQFRIALDQMNSSFMDLIYYSNDFKDSCKNIVTINNEFIKKLIKVDSLTHDKTFEMIQEYYELTDDNKKKISQLLEDIKKDIQKKFDDYYESDESPKSETFKTKSKLPDNRFDSLKVILDKSRDSIDSNDISDDFMESKIIPLYKDDDYDRYDNDDDDDDEANNKRYYGNPFLCVPKEVQDAINKFLSFENSIIAINNILHFNTVTDKYGQKAKTQEEKIVKEIQDLQKKIIQDRIDAENREKEKERKKRIQKLAENDIPELEEMLSDLTKQKTNLEKTIRELKDEKEKLKNDIHNLKEEETKLVDDNQLEEDNNKSKLQEIELTDNIQKLKEEENELRKNIPELKDEQTQLTNDIQKLKDEKTELEKGNQDLKSQIKLNEENKKIIINLLQHLSTIKSALSLLKQYQNNNNNNNK